MLFPMISIGLLLLLPSSAKILGTGAWFLLWAVFSSLWQRDSPSVSGAWAAFLIYVITILASWSSAGDFGTSQMTISRELRFGIRRWNSAVDGYRTEKKELPRSLDQVAAGWAEGMLPDDPWGRPWQLTVEGNSYRIGTLGRDGVRGGEGLDADWNSDNYLAFDSARLSLWQFVTDTPVTGFILLMLIAVCLICEYKVRDNLSRLPQNRRQISYILLLIVLSSWVCSVLATFHIALSQSRH